jgi:Zn-dependent protease
VVARVAGAPVVLAPTSLLTVAVIAAAFAPGVGARLPGSGPVLTGVAALAIAVLLMASVLVHEIAHGLVARARGLEVREYALTLFGGHMSFDGRETPVTTALVTVAGPVSSILVGGLLWLGAVQTDPGGIARAVLEVAAISSAFLGAFNLLPGLPMDGGFLLEAVVWAVTGDRRRGTVLAGWAGRVVAVGFLLASVVRPLAEGGRTSLVEVVWGAAIGALLWSGATQAIVRGRAMRAADALHVSAVGLRAVGAPATSVMAEADVLRGRTGAEVVVLLAPDGQPVAYEDAQAARSVPAVERAHVPLTAVAIALPAGAVVDATLTGGDLVHEIAERQSVSPVLVALDRGVVVALIRTADVAAALRG